MLQLNFNPFFTWLFDRKIAHIAVHAVLYQSCTSHLRSIVPMIQTLSEQYFPRIFKSNGKVLLNAHMTNPFRDSESLAPLPPLLSADGLSKVTVPSHRLNNAPHEQNLPKQLFDLYLSQSQPFRVDLMCTVTTIFLYQDLYVGRWYCAWWSGSWEPSSRHSWSTGSGTTSTPSTTRYPPPLPPPPCSSQILVLVTVLCFIL